MILCYYKSKFVGPFPSIPTQTEIDGIKRFIDSHLDLIPDSPNAIENVKYDDFFIVTNEKKL